MDTVKESFLLRLWKSLLRLLRRSVLAAVAVGGLAAVLAAVLFLPARIGPGAAASDRMVFFALAGSVPMLLSLLFWGLWWLFGRFRRRNLAELASWFAGVCMVSAMLCGPMLSFVCLPGLLLTGIFARSRVLPILLTGLLAFWGSLFAAGCAPAGELTGVWGDFGGVAAPLLLWLFYDRTDAGRTHLAGCPLSEWMAALIGMLTAGKMLNFYGTFSGVQLTALPSVSVLLLWIGGGIALLSVRKRGVLRREWLGTALLGAALPMLLSVLPDSGRTAMPAGVLTLWVTVGLGWMALGWSEGSRGRFLLGAQLAAAAVLTYFNSQDTCFYGDCRCEEDLLPDLFLPVSVFAVSYGLFVLVRRFGPRKKVWTVPDNPPERPPRTVALWAVAVSAVLMAIALLLLPIFMAPKA